MDEPPDQPTRRRIYEVLGEHPGASAREIQRLAGLAWGETAYHLDQLTKTGAIRRERGGHRDYYFRLQVDWDARRLLKALRSAAQRRLLVAITQQPGRTAAELSAAAALSLSTTSFHLRQLVATGAVAPYRDGGVRRYRPTAPEQLAELLGRYRESFRDRLVDQFVETWSSLLR